MKFATIVVYQIFLITAIDCSDYYKLLGISKDASKSEIRKAFKKIALEKHPDKNKENPNAHEIFTKINKAYEVLKDEELRKKYDLYGEEGLKDDHFSNKYQSWSFYKNNFGIYDDDEEIITLSKSDFEQSVSGTEDIWFINFYSPHCTHCHTLAPTWREVARELDGVVRIGAVNCQDDWWLCNQQKIHGYPSLKLYPTGETYYGAHDKEKMVEYVLSRIDIDVIHLSQSEIDKGLIKNSDMPWIISFCESNEDRDCLSERTLIKLAATLDNLVVAAHLNCDKEPTACKSFSPISTLKFYPLGKVSAEYGQEVSSLDAKEIVEIVLQMVPPPEKIDDDTFKVMEENIKNDVAKPVLLIFAAANTEKDLELRKLTALLTEAEINLVDCNTARQLCVRFHVHKFPTVLVFRKDGYEFHHGRYNAFDIANFAKESLLSNVRVLEAEDFHNALSSGENWFIDFYAPWCPPCLKLLPEWRKAGKQIGGKVAKFGTVDCTVHTVLCQQQNVRSYPTTIFFNQSEPHAFSGYHSADEVIAFAEDILHPPVVIFTPETFESLVSRKAVGETWVVDFYAPWCGPCMELAPVFRKLAKRLKGDAFLGQVDCQKHNYFCQMQGINAYPTVRLYPHQYHGSSFHVRHQGWRNLESMYSWVFQYFPSEVVEVNQHSFYKDVIQSDDSWLIDFYAPWCGHCVQFAPHYSKLAKRLKGKIKVGKVNCDQLPSVCREVGIRAYPTVVFYSGTVSEGESQSIYGTPINSLDTEYLYAHSLRLLENHRQNKKRLKEQKKKARKHDEF